MILRYSRRRHFTAGCSRPRDVVATNCNSLTTAPSPPVSVTCSHQAAAGCFAGLISERHDLIGRAHQEAVALLDKAADRAHVPDMILVRMHRALGRHHMEWSNADIPQRLDGPTVVAVRARKPFGKLQTNRVTFEESPDIDTPRSG